MPRRARPTTSPRPPPAVIWAGRVAIVMSALPSSTAAVSTPRLVAVSCRSPSTKSRAAGHAAVGSATASARSSSRTRRTPVSSAAALPRLRSWRTTSAPAARAASAVPSVLPVVDDDDPADLRQGGDGGHGRRDAVRLVLARDDGGDPRGERAHQRRVTWRLSRPERARRSSAVSEAVGGEGGGVPLAPRGELALVVGGLELGVEVPDRHEQAAGAEGAEQAGVAAEGVVAGGVQAGEGVGGGVLVVGQDEADVRPLADAHPVGRRQGRHRDGGHDGGVGPLERLGGVALEVLALDPEVEALVHGDLEGGAVGEHVLQARAVGGDLRRCVTTGWPGSAARAASSCPARSREASPLALPDWVPMSTVPSARCRPGQAIGSTVATVTSLGAPSGTCSGRTVTLRRGGREDLAQGDPVGLTRQPLERPALERRRPRLGTARMRCRCRADVEMPCPCVHPNGVRVRWPGGGSGHRGWPTRRCRCGPR